MLIPESITRISGPAYETGAFRPIILDGSERIIVVTQGYLDLFASKVSMDVLLRRSPFITRITAGQAIFDGPKPSRPGSGPEGFVFLAVPSRDTVLMETDRSKFSAKEMANIDTVILIDEWISGVSEILSRNRYQPPRDIQLLEADPNVLYPAGSTVSAHHSDVIWVSANRPVHFIGDRESTVEAETLLPLSEQTWLHLDTDTEISAVHTPALLGTERLWSALDRFSTLLLSVTHRIAERADRADEEHAQADRRDKGTTRAMVLRSVSEVLNTTSEAEVAAVVFDRTPLLTVAKLVAESVGGVLSGSQNDEESETAKTQPLASFARRSGMRTREISLAHDWPKRDGPSFVGRTTAEARPLAVLSNGRGSYRVVDPADGQIRAVDRKTADGIERRGLIFYPPLPDSVRTGLAALLHVLRRFGRDFQLLIAMAILSSLIALLTPILTGKLLAEIIPRGDESMWIAALGALGVGALGAAAFDVVGALAALRIEGRTDEQLQASIWNRMASLPTSFFRRFTAGDLADRANGVGLIRQMLTGATVHGLISGMFSVFSLGLLFYYSWTLALYACGISLALVAGSWILVRRQVHHYRAAFRVQGLIDGFVFQMITGVGKLRMANAEHWALAIWARRFVTQRRAVLAARSWGAGQHTLNAMFMPLSLLTLFAFIWYSLIDGGAQESFDLADFLSFNAAFGQFATSIVALTGAWTTISSTIPLFERVQPILECQPESSGDSFIPMDLTGDIEFARVTFRYLSDSPNAVDDVSFRIHPGDYVAFVGPSGSGKSTIYRLLLGFERPDSGTILIDGHDLLHIDLPTVRNLMGVVLQDSKLVAASIFENISGSSSLTMEEAWAAARAAGVEEDIRAMPMGMHTVLPEGGIGLSGGQKQRVLIARALARKPRIILFDEATSALDNRTQLIVQESLQMFNITRIVIAHRLSTVREADKIFVMKEGRIVETGRYEELMAQGGVFADLARRQVV